MFDKIKNKKMVLIDEQEIGKLLADIYCWMNVQKTVAEQELKWYESNMTDAEKHNLTSAYGKAVIVEEDVRELVRILIPESEEHFKY